jgi:hypothetical protein
LALNLSAKKGRSLEVLNRTMMRLEKSEPEHREMFMRGVMGQIKAAIETGSDFDNAAKIFSNARMRRLMTEMLGSSDAAAFYGLVKRANLAKRTQLADKGSQTASIQNVNDGWVALSRLYEAATSVLNLPSLLKRGAEAGAAYLKRKRTNNVMSVLGANTSEPHRLAEAIDLLKKAAPRFSTTPSHAISPVRATDLIPGGSAVLPGPFMTHTNDGPDELPADWF